MNLNFDFLTNVRATMNVILNAAVYTAIGMGIAWFAADEGTAFFSKSIMAAGILPVLAAVKERLMNKPEPAAKVRKSA
jgi:hypothetical protein